ncbi:unnamed protein product [Effrenium voratum]|nr:unnamed protein product [Effrenium voratum]
MGLARLLQLFADQVHFDEDAHSHDGHELGWPSLSRRGHGANSELEALWAVPRPASRKLSSFLVDAKPEASGASLAKHHDKERRMLSPSRSPGLACTTRRTGQSS